jgi:hypothetical protein
MSTFTDLFQYWQRPTDAQLEWALLTAKQHVAGNKTAKHQLFPNLPPEQFWRYVPAQKGHHGPIVSCVLDYPCSISGHPQGMLYVCERTLNGFEEARLTYRDPVRLHLLQGRTMFDGGLNMYWSSRPNFFGTIQCVFEVDLGFNDDLVAINFCGEANEATIDTAQQAIAGFTATTTATEGKNIIGNLCRWSAAVHISGPRMLVKVEGNPDAFPWEVYAQTIFGNCSTLPHFKLAVKSLGKAVEAKQTVAVTQAYLGDSEIQQLAQRINKTMREVDSSRYQALKAELWKLADQANQS